MLIKLFNGVIESTEDPKTYSIEMNFLEDNKVTLNFKRQMPFKSVNMLTCIFDTADQHISAVSKHKMQQESTIGEEDQPDTEVLIKQHIRHRHNIAK